MAKIGWYVSAGICEAFTNYPKSIFGEVTILNRISILLKFKLCSIPQFKQCLHDILQYAMHKINRKASRKVKRAEFKKDGSVINPESHAVVVRVGCYYVIDNIP